MDRGWRGALIWWPWVVKFNAKPIDKRWMPVVEKFYGWHYRNQKYLRNEKSLAEVAMVYSQQTAAYYGGDQAGAKVENASLGYYQALVEARIPFDMVHDQLLDAEKIDRYRVLIFAEYRGAFRPAVREADGVCGARRQYCGDA